jgi:hypothetical protein
MKTLVFFGFGFRDHDLLALFEKIARLTSPVKPAYAFLANCSPEKREEYRKTYHVEVIPYKAVGSDHSGLLPLLHGYGAFLLGRDIQLGKEMYGTKPEYDPQVTSLITHNRLLAGRILTAESSTRAHLLQSRVLTILCTAGVRSIGSIAAAEPQVTTDQLRAILSQLQDRGLVSLEGENATITTQGEDYCKKGRAQAELLSDKFWASILNRARVQRSGEDETSHLRRVKLVTDFFKSACRTRGLGVAQNLVAGSDTPTVRARTVALLRGLQQFLPYCVDREDAFAVIDLVRDVLSEPRDEEKQYLGILTQAFFGKHVLARDPEGLIVRRDILRSSILIADSSFLIPLLAKGSAGFNYAVRLQQLVSEAGCSLLTTRLLLDELVEHALWAWKLLNKCGAPSGDVLDAARGARGYRSNGFLVGYLNHPQYGPDVPFQKYFDDVVSAEGGKPSAEGVARSLELRGIIVQSISDLQGFKEEMWHEQETAKTQIKERREKNRTFTRDRQIQAEAEVAVMVSNIRRQKLSFPPRGHGEGFFLSHSRVVDGLPGQSQHLCLAPESLFELLMLTLPVDPEDAEAIYDQLLWELALSRFDVVPRHSMQLLFHNTIEASRDRLDEHIVNHKEILREVFTSDPEHAFQDIDLLSLPSIAGEVDAAILKALEEKVLREAELRKEAEAKAKRAEKLDKDYFKTMAKQKARKAKAIKKRRAIKSGHKGKKKRSKK